MAAESDVVTVCGQQVALQPKPEFGCWRHLVVRGVDYEYHDDTPEGGAYLVNMQTGQFTCPGCLGESFQIRWEEQYGLCLHCTICQRDSRMWCEA